GYAVVVPDLYDKMGGPVREVAKARENSRNLPDAAAVRDLQGAVSYLQQRPYVQAERIAAWGFCMGGRLAMLLAGEDPRVQACLVFYGDPVNDAPTETRSMNPLQAVRQVRGPFLGVFGALDKNITLDKVERLRAALAEANAQHDIHVFAEAGHAFFNDTHSSYHQASAEQAWTLANGFLQQALAR
ncbi:MAG: dienelactone hydrolase family protein, partial [Alicyclobacillus sp.]|nr:dienelactone hydrolase family protein [Alicyclobacillus sp.]